MLRASQKNINLDGRRGRKIRLWFIWFKEMKQKKTKSSDHKKTWEISNF